MQELNAEMERLGLQAGGPDGSGGPSPTPTHSNLYVNNLPHNTSEQQVEALFAPYGEVVSLRLVRASRMGASTKTFAFVKYATVQQAVAAISSLHQTPCGGGLGLLEVKFADADAGERNPELSAPPSDNLYCKNLPGSYTDDDLRGLFSPHGDVLECKLLHRGDPSQGAGALVRLGSVEDARRAIAALHNTRLPGGGAPLVVRFADSAEQKAKKAARMGRAYDRWGFPAGTGPPGAPMGGRGGGGGGPPHGGHAHGGHAHAHGRPPEWPGRGGYGHAAGGGGGGYGGPADGYGAAHGGYDAGGYGGGGYGGGGSGGYGRAAGSVGSDYGGGDGGGGSGYGGGGTGYAGSGGYGGGGGGGYGGGGAAALRDRESSIYIKYLPETADRLFLYEKFAPFGAVHSVKVLIDDITGLCKGVGFVNYCEPEGAQRAVAAMNNALVGDKRLDVAVQAPRRPR